MKVTITTRRIKDRKRSKYLKDYALKKNSPNPKINERV